MNKRYAMTMDTRRCVACNACVLSCKAENALPDNGFRDWIVQETRGRFPTLTQENRSERCNHCDNPPCVTNCPTGASHVADGGVVLVNYDKCSGCKACVAACPYDARYVHEIEGYIDKCTFCAHRLQRGDGPGCVDICPARALAFGDLADPESEVARQLRQRKYKVLQAERGLKPHMFFLL
jgi:Fe-S-cluster-containing dehydrogenase component